MCENFPLSIRDQWWTIKVAILSNCFSQLQSSSQRCKPAAHVSCNCHTDHTELGWMFCLDSIYIMQLEGERICAECGICWDRCAHNQTPAQALNPTCTYYTQVQPTSGSFIVWTELQAGCVIGNHTDCFVIHRSLTLILKMPFWSLLPFATRGEANRHYIFF